MIKRLRTYKSTANNDMDTEIVKDAYEDDPKSLMVDGDEEKMNRLMTRLSFSAEPSDSATLQSGTYHLDPTFQTSPMP